jgi:hypothetical protein
VRLQEVRAPDTVILIQWMAVGRGEREREREREREAKKEHNEFHGLYAHRMVS